MTPLQDRVEETLRDVFEEGWPIVGEFWQSCMNVEAINELGNEPLQPVLTSLRDAQSKLELIEVAGTLDAHFDLFTTLAVIPNRFFDASEMAIQHGVAELTIDNKRFYKDPEAWELIKPHYSQYIETLLIESGVVSSSDVRSAAASIMEIERSLAMLEDTASFEGFQAVDVASGASDKEVVRSHLDGFLRVAGDALPENTTIVIADSDIWVSIDAIVQQLSFHQLYHYAAYRYIHSRSKTLGRPFLEARFRFFRRVINGQEEPLARDKVCIADAVDRLPSLVGQYFVHRAFDEKQLELATSVLASLKEEMKSRLEQTQWLDSKTKRNAITKIKAIEEIVAKPDHTRTHPFVLQPDSFFENVNAIETNEWRRSLKELWKPTNRRAWRTSSAKVNAHYFPAQNAVMFPAAILLPPMLDSSKHLAEVFGSIASVMGHEIGHAFDTSGIMYDETGAYREWVAPEFWDDFSERVACFQQQYSGFEVFGDDGESLGFVDGNQTIGENMADNSGVSIALDAYRKLVDKSTEVAESHGINSAAEAEQLFFLSYAQAWCSKLRDEAMAESLDEDVHAPSAVRVLGVMMNSPEFADAFKCKAGTPMNPEEKCKVW
ncbi:hypothetical protein PINS_up004478 [Pythium insidiosum]|nr:hypothetical protein PINS_up004478 [Pythium insidiosum]